jgi:hypothetical protein
MEVCLEVMLELDFCTKPPNFGVEAHMGASTGVALKVRILPNIKARICFRLYIWYLIK